MSCNRKDIGMLSRRYESNGNPGAIGHDNTGGYSYGLYQIATLTGTFENFLYFLDKTYRKFAHELRMVGGTFGATEGTEKFKTKWAELARAHDHEFSQAQHDFIKVSHFDPAVDKLFYGLGIDVCNRSNALQDVVWSIAVQHGAHGCFVIFQRAIEKFKTNNFSDYDLINKVYEERGADEGKKYFSRSTPRIRAAVVSRFNKEKKRALQMLEEE